jgi:hypothetical protein
MFTKNAFEFNHYFWLGKYPWLFYSKKYDGAYLLPTFLQNMEKLETNH